MSDNTVIVYTQRYLLYRQISNISRTKSERRCSNYIWVINDLIAHKYASYIRYLTVFKIVEMYLTFFAADRGPTG